MTRCALVAWLVACGCIGDPPAATEPVERYTVVRGDTLGVIAKRYGVSVAELQAWNHLAGDRIEVGQILEVHTAAAPPAPARRRLAPGTVAASGAADLALPAPQACLAGPTEIAEDEGMAASEGLSYEQLRAALGGFVGNTLRCLPEGGASGTIDLAITVGCNGRVAAVRAVDPGGLDPAIVACVTDTLRFAPFPAHDLPDGFTFEYPLTFTGG